MIGIYHLTPNLRRQLKKPLGILLRGSLEEILAVVKGLIEREDPPKIVTVGDQVSQDLAEHSLPPDIMIVDNKIMRKEIPPISAKANQTTHVKNPPGTITEEAWNAIEKASRASLRTKIVVDGEEDLLALVAILLMPEGSLVFYGQPRKGVVAVRATDRMKQKVQKTLGAMKQDSKPQHREQLEKS